MKNWKTTLIGLLSGAGAIAIDAIQHGQTNVKTIALAIGIGLLGYHYSDAKSTTDATNITK
jgi:hypothetical protein